MTLLLEDQLVRLKQELEDVRAEYEEFAYTVSHDFGGPLRSIKNFAAIIDEKINESDELVFDEETKKYFSYIVSEADRARIILTAVKEYTSFAPRPGKAAECDLNIVLNDAIAGLQLSIDSSGAVIESEVLPVVMGDRDGIQLCFHHILLNAILYQDEGAVPEINVVSINTNDFWQLSVSDNGIGMKESAIERNFQILRRGVSSQEYPGMGMGLAIVKKIVKSQNGKVWVDSVKGHGSIVHFTLSKV